MPFLASASPKLSLRSKTLSSDNDVLIRVENVGKVFCRDFKKSLKYGFKDSLNDLFSSAHKTNCYPQRSLRSGEFWANKDISFELKRGECLGLIGHNGAGKTTLLKMLNGLIKPDVGRIEMRGRIGALIALGAGFNPVLTGRENIYVNGSILGFSKSEIKNKIEEIIDFAEIRDFIDTPVQTYSSGMQVRLGFAVATAMDPDILILDEVLAVGDSNFRTKCLARISSILESSAVIFVSHAKEQLIRICSRGIVLDKGMVKHHGNLKDCYKSYEAISKFQMLSTIAYHHEQIEAVNVKFEKREHVCGDDCAVTINYISKETQNLSLHVIAIVDESGAAIAVVDLLKIAPTLGIGDNRIEFTIKSLSLKPGRYHCSLELAAERGKKLLVRSRLAESIVVTESIDHWCIYTPVAIGIQNINPINANNALQSDTPSKAGGLNSGEPLKAAD